MERPNNIKVFARARPFTPEELELEESSVVDPTKTTPSRLSINYRSVKKVYEFDGVFNPAAPQVQVYSVVVAPLIYHILGGFTGTVFAYGPKGSGKTHTMIGQNVTPNLEITQEPCYGMVPRAAGHVFQCLNGLKAAYAVRVSFVEIYKEEVYDLLSSKEDPLSIYDDPDVKGAVRIEHLTEKTVNSSMEAYKLLKFGISQKQKAAEKFERSSSHSHTIFTIVVNTRVRNAAGVEIIRSGKLHLVDLAGSDTIGPTTGSTCVPVREALYFSRSLLAFKHIVRALAQNKPAIPYSVSSLTRILHDSLGGKGCTCIIATFSMGTNCFDQTISTLEFAQTARSVKNYPTAEIMNFHRDILQPLEDEVVRLEKELVRLKAEELFYVDRDSNQHLKEHFERRRGHLRRVLRQSQHLMRHCAAIKIQYARILQTFPQTDSNAEEFLANFINSQLAILNETPNMVLNDDKPSISLEVCHGNHETRYFSSEDNAAFYCKATSEEAYSLTPKTDAVNVQSSPERKQYTFQTLFLGATVDSHEEDDRKAITAKRSSREETRKNLNDRPIQKWLQQNSSNHAYQIYRCNRTQFVQTATSCG